MIESDRSIHCRNEELIKRIFSIDFVELTLLIGTKEKVVQEYGQINEVDLYKMISSLFQLLLWMVPSFTIKFLQNDRGSEEKKYKKKK